jgi:hypothetical protein
METSLTSAAAREGSTAQFASWCSLSRGLRLNQIGLCISLGTAIVTAALAPLVAVPDHVGFINDLDEILAFFLPLVAALGGLVGGLVVLVGDWFNTAVPEPPHARRLALWSALAISAGLPLLLLSPVSGPLAAIVSGLAVTLLTARNILFLLLLMQIAAALGHATYRGKMLRFFIYWLGGGTIAAVVCGSLIAGGLGSSMASTGMPQVGGDDLLPGLPLFGLASLVFVAYSCLLLWWLLSLIQDVRVRLPAAAQGSSSRRAAT